MQSAAYSRQPVISLYMFSSYFLSYTVRKRYWAAWQSFRESLKAPFKPKPATVCTLQEVILYLQKNIQPRRSLTPLLCDPGKVK